jgi:hypothetical protein
MSLCHFFVFPKLKTAFERVYFEQFAEQCDDSRLLNVSRNGIDGMRVHNVRRAQESYANERLPFASCSASGDIWFDVSAVLNLRPYEKYSVVSAA